MRISIGLVGLGRWGMNIKRTLEELGATVAVIQKGEPVPEKLEGVCIATPSTTHAEIALPYIERGIPTFIEKPMTTSTEDAARIVDAAQKSGALIFVGHIYLYNPAFRAVVELSRTIGTIQSITAEGIHNSPRPDSSVLWDWLPHHLSMAREILRLNPSSVRAEAVAPHTAREAAMVTYLFGIVSMVSHISWVAPTKKRLLTVVGTGGTIIYDEMATHKISLVKNGVEHPSYDEEPPLTAELSTFLAMVRTRKADRDHLEDAEDIIRAIEAAEAALHSGESVPIS